MIRPDSDAAQISCPTTAGTKPGTPVDRVETKIRALIASEMERS